IVSFFDPHGPDLQVPLDVTLDSTGKVLSARQGFGDGRSEIPLRSSPLLPSPLPAMTPDKAVELGEQNGKPLRWGVCSLALRPAGENFPNWGPRPNAYYEIMTQPYYGIGGQHGPSPGFTVDTVTGEVRELPI